MPRGWALGVTWQLPEYDKYSKYAHNLLEEIAILFGGRAAEEVFLNARSTGASNDFERATALARDMVARFGMTDAMGPMVYIDNENGPSGMSFNRAVAEDTQQRVDAEIRRILDEQYALAKRLLEENRDKVEAMTHALMEWETIDREQIQDIMAGQAPRPPKQPAAEAMNDEANTPTATEAQPATDGEPPVIAPALVGLTGASQALDTAEERSIPAPTEEPAPSKDAPATDGSHIQIPTGSSGKPPLF